MTRSKRRGRRGRGAESSQRGRLFGAMKKSSRDFPLSALLLVGKEEDEKNFLLDVFDPLLVVAVVLVVELVLLLLFALPLLTTKRRRRCCCEAAAIVPDDDDGLVAVTAAPRCIRTNFGVMFMHVSLLIFLSFFCLFFFLLFSLFCHSRFKFTSLNSAAAAARVRACVSRYVLHHAPGRCSLCLALALIFCFRAKTRVCNLSSRYLSRSFFVQNYYFLTAAGRAHAKISLMCRSLGFRV